MQMNKIPAEEVGAKIVEWYSCIMSSSYEEATLLKSEVKSMVGNMENSDKMLAYYSLVEYRHENMLDGNNKSVEFKDQFKFVETEMDHYLKYLYYFVSGQNEFNKQKYRTSIKMFRKAERLLEYVKDDTEEAEFLGYLGYAYYRINQYLISLSYLEQAETAFRRLNLPKKAINNKQIIGLIYVEIKQYEKGDQILKESLDESTYPTLTGIILRSIGLSKFSQGNYKLASSYFTKSLEIEEHKNSYFGMNSLTELSHSLYKLDEKERALIILKKAKASVQFYNDLEYRARCKFIEGLYELDDINMVDKALRELKEKELLFEVCELAEELIEIFREKSDNENVIKYYTLAYQAKLNQNVIGDGQR
ncbi:response regulator aspartate phosphatase B [Alkalihalobacillus xiaoxiensis]|uniref:Response regulator aspartate phosphatase B n=2 Tax=Shouchella xiaoxiensis TaxID=766895 RepID=A0ABS2SXN9_9BACI|nr:response regulator aspartate phosphatase B [Shouchella xiaoxiensis]